MSQETPHQMDISSALTAEETETPSETAPKSGNGNGGTKAATRTRVPATGNGKPKIGRLNNASGLTVTRRFTKPGVDVYSTVEWELRDAVISNERGEKVFEQRDVEIPKSWTQLATNVVVSKYFRGHIGTPERERSVRQLIGRVVHTITSWGKGMDYFASNEDAETFRDELTHILLYQMAAFNSPVWFNLGVKDTAQQASACFINSVEDTMESILTLAKTEGMLFKFGSGTGTNLSPIRASSEPLQGGGTASGPLSFMRGFDQFAGAIKSGGKTRRAAKMIILDIDHPDIVDFVQSKEKEEKKAWALIDAGYSGAFNVPGGAYDSVQFQNANHSVRVTDEFMQAYLDDAEWQTKFRMNGKPAHTYQARDIMEKIGQSAWVCGDPGMQYDTTINKWHTCKNTDRIYASNPCVTGDTLIATDQGWRTIEEMVGKSARIIGADGMPHFVDSIFPTGTKPVYRLRTRAGYEVRITGNHKVLTVERGDVAVEDLRLGEHLTLQGAGFGRTALSDDLALGIGIAVGDGCLTRSTSAGGLQEIVILTMAANESTILAKVAGEVNLQKQALRAVNAIGNPNPVALGGTLGQSVSRLSFSSQPVVDLFKQFAVLDEGSERKRFTPAIFDLDRTSLAGVLRGLFTADGTVANYGDKSQYVALDSTSQTLLQQVQTLLLSFGIKAKIYTERRRGAMEALLPDGKGGSKSYSVQEVHSLRISRTSRLLFEREIGFDSDSPKAFALAKMNRMTGAYRDEMTDSIESIELLGEEPVYDLTEPITHHFVANGLVVHNCSEYMFLNDSACNLASLNLMRFRTPEGEFDVEMFRHAVRVVLTAMEILVDNADYPTTRIAENSHDYRPLGLGYANLGALLMARGVPYDSDAGRAYAGAITALMTGEAYHQSAVIARDHGWAFPGYPKNREPFLEVMRMHRAAVEDINPEFVPDDLLNGARDAWDQTVATGELYGFRNAQASVLAPTGCLVANSLVLTDRGLMRLGLLGDVNGAQWQDVAFQVLTDEGEQTATKFYINGVELTRRLVTRSGYAIQGTLQHRIKVVDSATGAWHWKRFSDIQPKEVVALSMGQLAGAPRVVNLPPLGEAYWTGDYTTRAPRAMTPELAELIGYFMGDGSLHAKGPRFCVAPTDLDVAERIQYLMKSLFNLEARILPQQGYCEVTAHSVPLALWWEACGFAKHAPSAEHSGKGYHPHIPNAILATNDPAVYGAFLRGLYEADGTVTNGVPCWSSTHRAFSEEVKSLLLALGVPTTTKHDTTGWGNSTLYVLRLRNQSYNAQFLECAGFIGARKQQAVHLAENPQSGRHDYIYLDPALSQTLAAQHPDLRNALQLAQKRHAGGITRRVVQELYARTGDSRLGHALQFYYDTITANEDGGEQLTYDLSVPANVTYIANGFVSHNTIGFLMDCDTTGVEPDIAIVKYKSLVGGGVLKIVNNTVPEALERLGYTQPQIDAIIAYIDKQDTIEGAPGLKPEHLPVFDCAFKPANGERSIHYMGHIKMMAAAQPFLSGAISKTVNMPHEATPDEITQTYVEGWKLGLKAIAIYRDGSKRTQPLSTKRDEGDKKDEAKATPAEPEIKTVIVTKPLRRKLPDERASITHKFSIAGHEGYITVGMYEDGSPGEIFLSMNKEGSTISGLMDSFATAISLALQYGVPLQTLVTKFAHSRFEPSGYTNHADIRFAKSIMDYIFRWLGLKFLNQQPNPEGATLSNGNGNGDVSLTLVSENAPKADLTLAPSSAALTDHEKETFQNQADAPICVDCGSLMVRNGACYKCLNCGSVYGCS